MSITGPLFTRNLSRTSHTMTGASQMSTMWMYVPSQNTQGELPDTASGELEYYADDCTNQDTSGCALIYTRSEAKQLIATFNNGMSEEEIEALTDAGFGERDAFAALSLDEDCYQMYMDDLFNVGGSQGSVDYTQQGFPEVGEIPTDQQHFLSRRWFHH